MKDQLRLMDPLAAMSVATDLGMGQPPEKAMQSCLLATGLARALDLPDRSVRDVYLASLLRHLGCTATAATEARRYGGDELVSRRAAEPTDFGNAREMAALTLSTGRGTGVRRPHLIARAVIGDMKHGKIIFQSVCDAGSLLAARLGLSQEVQSCLYQLFERWDGKGVPRGLAKDEIALPARIGDVARQAIIFHQKGGPDAAMTMLMQRAGGWFDPSVVEVFRHHGRELLREIDDADPWEALLEAEPPPVRHIASTELDQLARSFADMVDLKSTYTLGHSSAVAELAERAARSWGLPKNAVVDLRRAALLHDVGRVGVSSGIWDKPGALTRGEREQVRLHPYYTERILACSRVLEPLGRIAGLHHERLDGSGYPFGASAPGIPTSARILAAADAFQAATQRRPYRPAQGPDQAADLLVADAAAGRFDVDCVKSVIEAAGHTPPPVRTSRPAGLTDREVEVLRLLARGLSNKEIARRLVISSRTAEHHVQHVYNKIGISTRAAAALFAMQHDLLRI